MCTAWTFTYNMQWTDISFNSYNRNSVYENPSGLFHIYCICRVINSLLQTFHLLVLVLKERQWQREQERNKEGQTEKTTWVHQVWSHCEVSVGGEMAIREREREKGQAPVPFRTLLGQTGILIRALEYHCFILQGSRTHTFTHLWARAHKVYRSRSSYVCTHMLDIHVLHIL